MTWSFEMTITLEDYYKSQRWVAILLIGFFLYAGFIAGLSLYFMTHFDWLSGRTCGKITKQAEQVFSSEHGFICYCE